MNWKTYSITLRYYDFLEKNFFPILKNKNISPAQISFAGFVFALLVPLGFWLHIFWGLLLILLSGFSDSIDGQYARITKRVSIQGAFWDSVLDRISDAFYLMGIFILFLKQGKWVFVAGNVILFVLLLCFLISYIKAKAESLGISCESGIMDRATRTVYLIIWLFLILIFGMKDGLMWVGLTLFMLLCFITVVQRLIEVNVKIK
ncbi:CDP-diacylglycerol--glycerol-3-phosphate 3-phosphatidyltransferase [Desulfonauticus submarinus]|uniref:CDP-diacylglycerol--glycerol-3-phosphate 3-phosphatidyltransferase n=1 Tax=Desulfonauticus submarinus TaxID=206665 RepID=A0A1H0FXT1_9BACT|nr:CDP-alcohol phosphatidyltransferase family protein [Desulfonauticus submarinus]SDN99371.1 CDP-diacylglycerol--glycerol-3-phosphate 3-phosphatidyltransferase [Desulfonauticus submarinus]